MDLLEPGDLRLGQVVIKRVAVVELGVNNGSGDGGSCFSIEVRYDTIRDAILTCARKPTRVSLIYRTEPTTIWVWTNTAKLTNMVIAGSRRPGAKSMNVCPQFFFNSGIGAHQIACVRRPLDFYRESVARRWTV